MKSKKIKKLRKQIADPDYHKKRMQQALRASRELESFWKFECRSFFVGEVAAHYNQKVYNRKIHRVNARIHWYERKLECIN